MLTTHYVGLDIHKKTISFCVGKSDGTILQEGTVAANCQALDERLPRIPQPWVAGMEATMFTGWVYDHLLHYSAQVKVVHPAMLKAISAGKKKNDRVDAQKISDLQRCNYVPECHVASREIRDRRRVLRYRNLIVRQSVQMKNRVGSMLMETGIVYNKQKLHQRRCFSQLLSDQANAMSNSMPELLRLSRLMIDGLGQMNKQLLQALHTDQVLADRVQRLMTIPGVGQVLSLTWALEMGDITRFRPVKDAISYCGLCGAEQSSGGKTQRSPSSKQRNKHLQTTLIEAAKVATRWHPELAILYEREKQKANRNRGTLAVARKIVAYLLAVDRSKRNFEPRDEMPISAQA